MKVFLGGTVADSTWRQELIPKLTIDFFNPVVEDWNEEAHQRELYEREHCDFNLYVITPKLVGYYSIAEVMDDAMKKSGRTIYCFFNEDGISEFSPAQIVSLEKIGRQVASYGAVWARSLQEIADFLNYAGEYGMEGKTNEQIKLEADYLAAYRDVNTAADQWGSNQEDPQRLWQGTSLNQGLVSWKKLGRKPADHLSDVTLDMQKFVEASIALGESSRKTNLFISYSRDPSTPLARGLYEHLKEKYEVWYDKVSIPHGEDFKVSIEKGIRNCDNFLYIISNRAVRSPYCQAELDLAKVYGKRIIPIQQEEDVDNDLIDQDIRDINRIFPVQTNDETWDQEALEDQIGKVAELDVDLVASHTYFLKRAVAWRTDNFNTRLLMYDHDIERYDKWAHDLIQQKILTNPITAIHQSYYSESLAFSKLNYREFWIAGHDLKVENILREEFSIGFNAREGAPEGLFKAMNFLYILNEESSHHAIWKDQLVNAREHGMPVYFIDMGTSKEDTVFQPLSGEKVIDGSDGLDVTEIEDLKNEVSITIGPEFRYFKSPGFMTLAARHWLTRNKQKSDLMRGEMLSYFLYYQQTYPLKLSETSREYLETSKATTDHVPFDLFLARQKCKLNFSYWLGSQLLNQQLTSWNQHEYQNGDTNEREEDLREGIKNSLNFALILSNDEGNILEDEWIRFQLEEAQRLEKRIFILSCDETEEPEALLEYPTIDFRTNPNQAAFELINSLTTDQAFIKFFNDLYPKALQWSQQENSAKDLLLSGFLLDNAENQIKGHEKEVPEIFLQFIEAGRKESNARARLRRITQTAIVVLAIISAIVAVLAIFSSYKATQQSYLARLSRIEATIEKFNAQEAFFAQKLAQEEAERRRIQADLSAETAQCKQYEADSAKLVAVNNEILAQQEKQNAENERRNSDRLKTIARRRYRLSQSLIDAYQIRNTESNLIDDGFPELVVRSYFFHKNDHGPKSDEPDIFSALFKVATSDKYRPKIDLIKSFDPGPPVFDPFSVKFLPETNAFYELGRHNKGTQLTVRKKDTLPVIHSISDQFVEGGHVAPDGQHFWFFGPNGLKKYDMSSRKEHLISDTTAQIRSLVIANIPAGPEDTLGLPYVMATRSETDIIIYQCRGGNCTEPFRYETSKSVYPEAIDIVATSSGYILSYGIADSVIAVLGKKMKPPNMNRKFVKRIVSYSSEADHISTLDQDGFKIAIGTEKGRVAVVDIGLIDKAPWIETNPRAKSSMKKIALDSKYFAAVSFGNELEKSKIILNTVHNETQSADRSEIAHVERQSDDVIKDILISGGQLYYIENNEGVKHHTLSPEEIVEAICLQLSDCESELKDFQDAYREEKLELEELIFCKCNQP